MYTRIDPAKLADVQTVANKLADLPRDALIYISGYVEGCRGTVERQAGRSNGDAPATGRDSA